MLQKLFNDNNTPQFQQDQIMQLQRFSKSSAQRERMKHVRVDCHDQFAPTRYSPKAGVSRCDLVRATPQNSKPLLTKPEIAKPTET